MAYSIKEIYTHYKNLNKKLRSEILTSLQSQGINIVKIEVYEYPASPGIKHMFFHFADDRKKAVPYFMLDKNIWKVILREIMTR